MKNKNVAVPSTQYCAFCDYLAGARPYTVLIKYERAAILVTREQRGEPHLLVVPLRHVETILDLPDEDAGALMIAVKAAARAIDKAYQRAGIAIWQNNGVDADQTIPHLHFHVAGTLDTGGTERGDVPERTIAETDSIADLLRPWL